MKVLTHNGKPLLLSGGIAVLESGTPVEYKATTSMKKSAAININDSYSVGDINNYQVNVSMTKEV